MVPGWVCTPGLHLGPSHERNWVEQSALPRVHRGWRCAAWYFSSRRQQQWHGQHHWHSFHPFCSHTDWHRTVRGRFHGGIVIYWCCRLARWFDLGSHPSGGSVLRKHDPQEWRQHTRVWAKLSTASGLFLCVLCLSFVPKRWVTTCVVSVSAPMS